MGLALFTGPNDIECGVITIENSDPSETGKIMDEIMVTEDGTTRVVIYANKKYAFTLTISAPSKLFDSVNGKYFEYMIRSVKVK